MSDTFEDALERRRAEFEESLVWSSKEERTALRTRINELQRISDMYAKHEALMQAREMRENGVDPRSRGWVKANGAAS